MAGFSKPNLGLHRHINCGTTREDLISGSSGPLGIPAIQQWIYNTQPNRCTTKIVLHVYILHSYIEQIFCVESGGFNRLSIFITKLKLRQFQIHYYECFLLSIQAHEKSLFLFIVSNPMGLNKSPSSSIFASKLVSVRTLFWIIKTNWHTK